MIKKQLLLFLILLSSLAGYSQTITPQWKALVNGVSEFHSGNKVPAGYDSLMYMFFLRNVFKNKGDTINNNGYLTRSYFNLNSLKKSDTVGTVLTRYSLEHDPHTFYASQLFKGNLEVQGAILYVRPNSGTYPYVYADNSTVNALGTGGAVLLNGNSQTVQWNIGAHIGKLHADNMSGNWDWYMPNKSDTLVGKSDLTTAISGVVTNSIKNQSSDSPDSTQSAGFNINGDGVFWRGINHAVYDGNGFDMFSPVDSVTHSMGNHAEGYSDQINYMYLKTVNRYDTTRISGNQPVQYETGLYSKTLSSGPYGIPRNMDLPGGGIGLAYSKTQADSAGTIHLIDKAALQAYSGSATTVIVIDSLFGKIIPIFNYYPSVTHYDGGIVIQATGKGSGAWVRAYNGNGYVYPEWWGAKPFYPFSQTNSTGFDSRAAIQAAIDYIPHRNTTVQLTTNYLVKDSLQVGEGTKIIGLNRLIPNQLDSTSHFPTVDTIKYKSQTALHFLNNTDGIVTTLDTVNYRNQGIVIKDVAIFGSGKNNGKTGVLLRLNPNSTAALTKPGLFYLDNVSLGNFSTLADGRGVSDSWYIRNMCHFMNSVYGVRTGTSNTWCGGNDFYNNDIGFESNARADMVSDNEFEGNKQPGQLGIWIKGTDGIFHHNTIMNIYDGFKASSTAARNSIDDNIMQASRYDYLDSASTSNSFFKNHIYSGINTIAGQIPVKLRKNSHFVGIDNTFITGSVNSTIPMEVDTCTNIVLINTKTQNYALSDARAISFVGTTTFARITDFADRFFKGITTMGNATGGSGGINIVGDNDVISSTFERVASGASTARANFSTYTKYGGTIASPTALPNGSIILANQFRGYTGSALSGTSILERLETRTAWTGSATATKWVWSAIPKGTITKVDQMNLTGSGLKIGDTTAAVTPLDVTGRIRVTQGLTGSATDSVVVHDNTSKELKLKSITDFVTTDVVNIATDANYTITSANQFVKLPVVTANRTVSIPTASSYTGRIIRIWNQNTSGTFSWSFTGATVKDAANNTLTSVINTSVYILESDGSVWVKQN